MSVALVVMLSRRVRYAGAKVQWWCASTKQAIGTTFIKKHRTPHSKFVNGGFVVARSHQICTFGFCGDWDDTLL
jgi:hypothetical protein